LLESKQRNKDHVWPYPSSIMIRNDGKVPLFEEFFGQLDYIWLLEVTKKCKCKQIDPCVIRYDMDDHLGMNMDYINRDFYISLLYCDGKTDTLQRVYSSYAKRLYVKGNMKQARFYFRISKFDWRLILYFVSSYIPCLSRKMIKIFYKFN